jgi:tRNA(adenine34) deaminase
VHRHYWGYEVSNDQRFMREALTEAHLAFRRGEIPVGAIAVFQGQVIARGHNRKETDKDPTAHAEILALRQAAHIRGGWRLSGVTLYCTMEPCPMCAGAMTQARLPRLVYALDDAKAGAAGSVIDLLQHPGLNHHTEVTRGILASDAASMLADFFEKLRNGTIPRFSRDWDHRRLAESGNSV